MTVIKTRTPVTNYNICLGDICITCDYQYDNLLGEEDPHHLRTRVGIVHGKTVEEAESKMKRLIAKWFEYEVI